MSPGDDSTIAPGDSVESNGGTIRLWRTEDDIENRGEPLAKIKHGQRALVLSVGKDMLFVLFNNNFGYVYATRIVKAF